MCCRTDASKRFPVKAVLNIIQNQWAGCVFFGSVSLPHDKEMNSPKLRSSRRNKEKHKK